MKKVIGFAALAFVLAGCSSVIEIHNIKSPLTLTDDGARPIAEVTVKNVSYEIFGCIPLSSGKTWKGECAFADRDGRNTVWFENQCSPDDNIIALKAALKTVGSNKVDNLVERTESWAAWSLWIFWQTIETTSCTVLK